MKSETHVHINAYHNACHNVRRNRWMMAFDSAFCVNPILSYFRICFNDDEICLGECGLYSMNDRERLINCLTFKEVDRPPYFIIFGPWHETKLRWREESGDPNLDLNSYFKTDKGFLHAGAFEGIFPQYETVVLEEDEKYIVFRDGRGIVARHRKGGESMPEFLEYPVKCRDDWERLKKERLNPDQPERFNVDWKRLAQRREEGYAIQVGTYPYGVFGTPRDLMGAEELLCSFITDPELVKDMMDYLADFWIRIWERVSEHIQIDHIHIWEDMSGKQGSLISPTMIEEFMMPNYRKIKEFADSKNIPVVSVDTDGNCDELIPIMKKNGVNMMFPFEVQAGCDIEKYRELYPDFAIMGGLDKRALAKGKDEIDKELAKAERMFKYNGYVAGPDHLIPPDVSWENYKYFMESLRDIVGKKV